MTGRRGRRAAPLGGVPAGAAADSTSTSQPSVHSAAATRASWPAPVPGLGDAAATATWSTPRSVSSTKLARLPTPTWTNARTPSPYSASTSSRNRTGATR